MRIFVRLSWRRLTSRSVCSFDAHVARQGCLLAAADEIGKGRRGEAVVVVDCWAGRWPLWNTAGGERKEGVEGGGEVGIIGEGAEVVEEWLEWGRGGVGGGGAAAVEREHRGVRPGGGG